MSRAGCVRLRPLETGETAPLLEIFAGLGPRSRELRFLTPMTRLTATVLSQLSTVDGIAHVVVAESPDGRPIGVARFIRDPEDPESADVAVTVVDAWQGNGVGTLLASTLLERGHEVGVRRFTLAVRRDNVAVIKLLDRVPGDVELLADYHDTAEFAVVLPRRCAGPDCLSA